VPEHSYGPDITNFIHYKLHAISCYKGIHPIGRLHADFIVNYLQVLVLGLKNVVKGI